VSPTQKLYTFTKMIRKITFYYLPHIFRQQWKNYTIRYAATEYDEVYNEDFYLKSYDELLPQYSEQLLKQY